MKKGRFLLLFLPLIAVSFGLFRAVPAHSYLPTLESPSTKVRWATSSSFLIQWNLNPNHGANVGSSDVAAVMQASFDTWSGAPNVAFPITRGPNTTVSSEASSPSNINLICFVCTDNTFTGDSQTLAVTIFTFATAAGQNDGHGGQTQFAGQMVKADILFNPADEFDTGTQNSNDLQTIATHEIGHFLGLNHSGVVNSVLFPFSPAERRTLSYDDVAGASVLYPKSGPDVATGTVTGTVRLGNTGVFGAHVFLDPTTSGSSVFGSNVRRSPISTLTDANGTYSIEGVPPDTYSITAEPLDGPVTNDDVSDYAPVFGRSGVQTNFTTRQH